jgi:hypothetical protein
MRKRIYRSGFGEQSNKKTQLVSLACAFLFRGRFKQAAFKILGNTKRDYFMIPFGGGNQAKSRCSFHSLALFSSLLLIQASLIRSRDEKSPNCQRQLGLFTCGR